MKPTKYLLCDGDLCEIVKVGEIIEPGGRCPLFDDVTCCTDPKFGVVEFGPMCLVPNEDGVVVLAKDLEDDDV